HTNGHSTTKGTSLEPCHHGFGTRAIHVGSESNQEPAAIVPSICPATTHKQGGIGNHRGSVYSRSGNPNRSVLDSTLAAIEGGAHSPVFASGTATTAMVGYAAEGIEFGRTNRVVRVIVETSTS
ncbi:hypothetical protein BDM02DRAFT_3087589, partial [Thelephora ganbajun]